MHVSLIKSAHAIILYIIVYIFIYFPGLDPDPAASQLGFLRFANFTWCVEQTQVYFLALESLSVCCLRIRCSRAAKQWAKRKAASCTS